MALHTFVCQRCLKHKGTFFKPGDEVKLDDANDRDKAVLAHKPTMDSLKKKPGRPPSAKKPGPKPKAKAAPKKEES